MKQCSSHVSFLSYSKHVWLGMCYLYRSSHWLIRSLAQPHRNPSCFYPPLWPTVSHAVQLLHIPEWVSCSFWVAFGKHLWLSISAVSHPGAQEQWVLVGCWTDRRSSLSLLCFVCNSFILQIEPAPDFVYTELPWCGRVIWRERQRKGGKTCIANHSFQLTGGVWWFIFSSTGGVAL